MTNPAEFFDDPEFDTTDLLMNEPTPPGHRSGFVAVVGRPNVGKSTLMNHYLGQKIAIVSPKPQTTRNQLLGILTLPDPDQPELSAACPPAQVVFIDTPGMHRPEHKLGEYLLTTAQTALAEADIIIWLVDVSRPPGPEEQLVADSIAAARNSAQNPPVVILVLNKIDLLLHEEKLPDLEQIYLDLFPADHWLAVSATRGDNLVELLQTVVNQLPEGPRYFPADQVTDQQLRFIAAELIREAALHILRDEVPHALAVFVTEFTPRHENLTYISADLILERSAHKQIVIGEKGKTLKQIGQRARPEIEQMVGTRVYLELWVKIRPKWRKNINQLRWLGYSTS